MNSRTGLTNILQDSASDSPVKNITELIEFNKSDSVELRYFNQKTLELADKKGDLDHLNIKKLLL